MQETQPNQILRKHPSVRYRHRNRVRYDPDQQQNQSIWYPIRFRYLIYRSVRSVSAYNTGGATCQLPGEKVRRDIDISIYDISIYREFDK